MTAETSPLGDLDPVLDPEYLDDLAEPDYFWVCATSVGLACLATYLAFAHQHWLTLPVAVVALLGARDSGRLHGHLTRGALLAVLIAGVALLQLVTTLGRGAALAL